MNLNQDPATTGRCRLVYSYCIKGLYTYYVNATRNRRNFHTTS